MRIKKDNQRWLDNSRFPALEAVCLLFGIVFVLIHFSLWPVKKSYVPVLNNQMKNFKQKRLDHLRFPVLQSVYLLFPLLSFWVLIGSLWRLLWIWFHNTQSKLAEWRHYAGADIPPTKRSTSWTDWYWDFKLSISFRVMPAFCRSSKLFTIGVILQNVFRYVVYEGTPRSRPLWMFRDTRSDKSPGPRNKFSCTDLEKSLRKESDQPKDQSYANQYRVLISNW